MTTHINCRGINLKRLMLQVVVWMSLSLVYGHASPLSREEYLKLKRHLKNVNKPAVKSVKNEYGDIYDCIDIYKQLAFDHPLLKNHTLQLRSTPLPKRTEDDPPSDNRESHAEIKPLLDGGCPEGTVPIRRILMEDLLRAPSIYLYGKKYGTNTTSIQPDDIHVSHHYANILSTSGEYYGTKLDMNLWNPQVGDLKMFSLGQLWVVGGPVDHLNIVEAGLMVYPFLYHDQRTRFFVYWTGDAYRNGCYNTLCPSFIQLNNKVAVDTPFEPTSTYNGKQWMVTVSAQQDRSTGNWVIMYGDNDNILGYFPSELFPYLGKGPADRVTWGGETYNPLSLPNPPMGSGHFPDEGYAKACYMRRIRVMNASNSLVDASLVVSKIEDIPRCYQVSDLQFSSENNFNSHFYYGGPGGNC